MRLVWSWISCTVASWLQWNLASNILMILAIKYVQNLPPHFSYVSTLPNIIQNRKATLSSSQQCEWLWKEPVLVGLKWLWKRDGYVARLQQVFEVTSRCLYKCTRPCLTLDNGFIDDALRNTVPSVNEPLPQFVTVANQRPVNVLLHPAPDAIVNGIQIQTVGWLQLWWYEMWRLSLQQLNGVLGAMSHSHYWQEDNITNVRWQIMYAFNR